MVGTAYTELAYNEHARVAKMAAGSQASHVWVKPGNPRYWYTDPAYQAAWTPQQESTPRFDQAPPPQSKASTDCNVFCLNEKWSQTGNTAEAELVLSSFVQGGIQRLLKNIAHVEAASLTLYDSKKKVHTHADFNALMGQLVVSGSSKEPLRIPRLRHPWSVFGGEMVNGQFRGYLTLCLDDSGF